MKRKTRILAIAPYESLRDMMIRIANQRDDIELTVEVGVIGNGAEIAKRHEDEDFDAILSRGGTKIEIEKVTSKPVFEIPISYFDLLNIIKLAEHYQGKVAILAYENIAKSARVLCDIFHYDYNISVIDFWHNAKEKVQKLGDEGYTLIIGDAVSVECAEDLGIQSMLLISGQESVKEAFDNTVNVCNHYSRLKMEDAFFQAFVRSQNDKLMAMDENGNVAFSTFSNEKKSLLSVCRNLIPSIQVGETFVAHKKLSEGLFTISGNKSRVVGQTFYLFSIQKNKTSFSYLAGLKSIRVYNYDDFLEQNRDELSFIQHLKTNLWKRLDPIAESGSSVLLTGESGTEKEKLACQIYLKSKKVHDPLYIVNCPSLSEKDLHYLLHHEKSPLYALQGTVYFKGIQLLDDNLFEPMLNGLQNISRTLRCRMIFTCEKNTAGSDGQREYYRRDRIKNQIGCMEIELPPLRDCREEIPNFALLHIHHRNRQNGTNLVGLEPEAISLLQEYYWPQNVSQLQRILDEAMLYTTSPWITSKTVRQILTAEKQSAVVSAEGTQINLKQPMSGILYDAAMLVLSEENMNQAKTAKRLGISRTTLWRLLRRGQVK